MDNNYDMITAILDAFEDGIYVMNEDLVVEYMNSAMIAEFGEGVGKKCHQLVNHSEEKCPWCLSDEVFAGNTVRREVYIPIVDKTYYLTEIPFKNADSSLSKLSIYQELEEAVDNTEPGFFKKLGNGLEKGWNGILAFIIVLGHIWPMIIIIGIALFFILKMIRKGK